MRIKFFLTGIIGLAAVEVMAQDQGDEQQDERFTIDTPVTLDFDEKDEPVDTKKKKKPKKKVFYGIKTRKGFTRKGFGDRVTYEIFMFLKNRRSLRRSSVMCTGSIMRARKL
jgi:hypothetical protein